MSGKEMDEKSIQQNKVNKMLVDQIIAIEKNATRMGAPLKSSANDGVFTVRVDWKKWFISSGQPVGYFTEVYE